MTFSFTSLSSSSKGNCTFIQTEKTRILVDVGISGSKTEKLLKSIDINPQTIDAIFITPPVAQILMASGFSRRRMRMALRSLAEPSGLPTMCGS